MTRLASCIPLSFVILCPVVSAGAEQTEAFKKAVGPLLENHCITCHGPDTQKAGLRLDTLSSDLRDEKARAAWTKVFDKVVQGKMPPPKREQPEKAELDQALNRLKTDLHAASLADQQQRGRVVLRRLNGTEYENTLRDLLGTNVSLKDMLPEDNAAGGFDNVSAALEISPTHLLLYQEAAEKAVASVVPPHPPVPFSGKWTGKQIAARGSNFNQTLGRSCLVQGDSLVVYSKLPRYGLCSTSHVQASGRYRIKMSIAAVGEANKPVAVAFQTVGQGREDAVTIDCRDVLPGKPAVVEYEVDLQRRQAFVVNMPTLWDIRGTKKPIEEHKGPGFILEWISIEGPIDPFPPPSYAALFKDVPLKARSVMKAEMEGKKPPTIPPNRNEQSWQGDPLIPVSADPKKDAERLIRSFLPRAFRRPVTDDVVAHYVKRVHEKLEEKYGFYEAMTFGYKAILSSPHFLLFDEPGSTAARDGKFPATKLDDYALASRLSYFLCSGPPDEELLAVAAKGQLSKPEVLRQQTDRLLKSPRAQRFTENFVGQWLDLRKMDATIPDPQLYGDFDGLLLWSMPRETHLFFEEVLRENRSLLEFVDSDWTMLNERLAKLYDIPGVEGNAFRKVKLPANSHRGGVMTHASVLKVTADGTRTSPVLRGKWVLERIIGMPPDPPPPDVPAIEPDIRGATTIRQQLDKHRTLPACATCHVYIDPPGFALETFDPIGGYRDFYRVSARTNAGIVKLPHYSGRPVYRGPDIEKGGETFDGKKFETVDDYKKLLLTDKDQIARNLAEKLLTYATGAEVQFADREVIEEIITKIKKDNYGFRTLIHEIVQSRPFVNK